MRRKQLFALALAGALTFSLTPTSLLADDMSDAPAVAASAEAGAEETAQEQPAQQETPAAEIAADVVVDTPAPEVPTEAPTEAPTQAPTEAPTQAPTEAPTQAPTEAPTEAPTQAPTEAPVVPTEPEGDGSLDVDEAPAAPTEAPAATVTATPTATPTVTPTESPTPTPEDSKTKAVTNEAELISAIAEADETATAVIDIANDIELSQTVTIPTGKKICLVTMASAAEISRAVGFKEDMFSVSGTLSFLKANKAGDSNQTSGTLTIDGALIDETATGSIVHVNADAIFAIDDSAELTGNRTTEKGGAIYSDGLVLLLGGSIWGNTAEDGGAIYANNLVSIEKSADATGNYASDGVTKNNIALDGPATLVVDGAITIGRAGVHAVEPTEGKVLVQLSETAAAETTLAEALNSIELDDDSEYKLNATGSLVAATTDAPTPTPTQVPSITPELGRVSGPEWIDENTASITCTSDMDGWYYAAAARETDEVPEFEVNEDGIPVKAGEEFTVTVTVPEDDDNYCIYVLIKGENYTLSSKKKAPLDSTTRPGHEVETEDETAAEAVGAEAEGTEETETEVTEEENTEEAEAEGTEEENAEETEEETTEETEEEEEVSEEDNEEKPEAVGEGEKAETVSMSSSELTGKEIALKKGREVPFTLVLDKTEEEQTWTLDDITQVIVTDTDGKKVSNIPVELVNRKEGKYKLMPSEDIKEAKAYTLSVSFKKEGEETRTATSDTVTFTSSVYQLASTDAVKLTGLDESYYFSPGKAYDFTVKGVGPRKDLKPGDTVLVPVSFALEGEPGSTTFEDERNVFTKSGSVSSTKGIFKGKDSDIRFRVYFKELEYPSNGTKWLNLGTKHKTFKIKALGLPTAETSARVLYIGQTTTHSFDFTDIPEKLEIRGEKKEKVAYELIEGTVNESGIRSYQVKLTGENDGVEKVDVYFTRDGEDFIVKQYTVNVYQNVYAKAEKTFTEKLDVKSGQDLTYEVDYAKATPSDCLVVNVDKDTSEVSIEGAEKITKGYARVLIEDTATKEEVGRYIVRGVTSQSTTITIPVGGVHDKYDFDRSSDYTVNVSSEDNSIATVDKKETSTGSEKNIKLIITGKKADNTVVHYYDEGTAWDEPSHNYTINVNVTEVTPEKGPSLVEGDSSDPIYFYTNDENTIIKADSDDPSIATVAVGDMVAATGTSSYAYQVPVTITGVKAGTTTINVYKDGVLFKKYNVTVTKAAEPERDPIIADYTKSEVKIHGTTVPHRESMEIEIKAGYYAIDVVGAGMNNTSPVKGDVRYYPIGWSQGDGDINDGRKAGGWQIHAKSDISGGKEIPIRVYYLRQTYNGVDWGPDESTVSTKSVKDAGYFTVHTLKTISDSTTSGTGTSTSSGSGTSYSRTTDSSSSSSSSTGSTSSTSRRTTTTPAVHSPTVTGGASGSTQVGNARTGDSAPVGTMLLLGMMSLLTGGYVVSRKRKDDYDI